ncbi:MAG TPA: ABC transporter ATP-binding protein [Planctomycetaceae bacterium]|nr:ABC transporter ATP-binding protein [Planctomycetaceae bacterium]
MPDAIVSVENAYKEYTRGSEKVEVLKGVSMQILRGEFVALIGPSGSGKTTLLNLIAGLDQPTRGKVSVANRDISRMTESELARWRTTAIGFVFQFYHLIPVLTAYENVELPLLLLNMSARRRREQVMTAITLVGLQHRLTHRPGQLSGGEQQRVGIARAVVTDPALVVADEPTGDLDGKKKEEILDLLQSLQEGLNKTILMVTHDLTAASRAHRLCRISDGKLLEEMGESRDEALALAFPDAKVRGGH